MEEGGVVGKNNDACSFGVWLCLLYLTRFVFACARRSLSVWVSGRKSWNGRKRRWRIAAITKATL